MTKINYQDILDYINNVEIRYELNSFTIALPKEWYDMLSQEDIDRIKREKGVKIVSIKR